MNGIECLLLCNIGLGTVTFRLPKTFFGTCITSNLTGLSMATCEAPTLRQTRIMFSVSSFSVGCRNFRKGRTIVLSAVQEFCTSSLTFPWSLKKQTAPILDWQEAVLGCHWSNGSFVCYIDLFESNCSSQNDSVFSQELCRTVSMPSRKQAFTVSIPHNNCWPSLDISQGVQNLPLTALSTCSCSVFPSQGKNPVTRQYITTPRDQTSTSAP